MKRVCAVFATLALLITLFPAALGAEPTQIVAMRLGSPDCVIGTQLTQVDEASALVTPVVENQTTLVPIRRVLEAFGGTATYDGASRTIICTLNETEVVLVLDYATAKVNGAAIGMDAPAKALNGRTFVPVRFVSEQLGLQVGYEAAHKIIVVANGDLDQNKLGELPQVKTLIAKIPTAPAATPAPASAGEPVKLTTQTYALTAGKVTANVVTVNMRDPRVSVRSALPGGKLNTTQDFKSIAQSSGAMAVINANFFNSYSEVKDPVGHVMAYSQFLFASTGSSALGITSAGEMRYGRPAVFVRIKTADGGTAQEWSAFEVNVLEQFANQAVLYTPVRGAAVPITYPGAVLTVDGGVSTAYRTVAAGERVAIPASGYLVYFSKETAATDYFRIPELGRKLTTEPYLFKADEEGFTLDGVQTIISGAPRLVKNGAIETYIEPQYAGDARFTTNISPRTAVGSTADGKLLMVCTPAASITQMKQLMLQLGCVDAINLDGGGSVGLYFNGKVVSAPGRALATTFQVFVNP